MFCSYLGGVAGMLCNSDFLTNDLLSFVLSAVEIWSFWIGMCLNQVIFLMGFGSEGNDAVSLWQCWKCQYYMELRTVWGRGGRKVC